MGDIGCGGQGAGQEALIGVPVMGDDLQQEIGLARQHVAFTNFGPLGDGGFESAQIRIGLAVQSHLGKHGDVIPQGLGSDLGVIPFDKTGFFQGAYPPQAGRGRDSNPLGQIHVGHSAVSLQISENAAVDVIQLDPLQFESPKPIEYVIILQRTARFAKQRFVTDISLVARWVFDGYHAAPISGLPARQMKIV